MSPCRVIPNGFVCSSGYGSPRQCDEEGCTRNRTRQCDFPLVPIAFGEPVVTCDRNLCSAHATRVSRDQDYCPEHAATLGVR